jgi:hypothetical protein
MWWYLPSMWWLSNQRRCHTLTIESLFMSLFGLWFGWEFYVIYFYHLYFYVLEGYGSQYGTAVYRCLCLGIILRQPFFPPVIGGSWLVSVALSPRNRHGCLSCFLFCWRHSTMKENVRSPRCTLVHYFWGCDRRTRAVLGTFQLFWVIFPITNGPLWQVNNALRDHTCHRSFWWHDNVVCCCTNAKKRIVMISDCQKKQLFWFRIYITCERMVVDTQRESTLVVVLRIITDEYGILLTPADLHWCEPWHVEQFALSMSNLYSQA